MHRFRFAFTEERAFRLRFQLAGKRLAFPGARRIGFRRGCCFRFGWFCGLRGRGRSINANPREIIVKRPLRIIGG